MKLTEKWWCGNCGKRKKTITDVVNCACKPRPLGKRAIDKTSHYTFFRDELVLVKKK